MKQTFEIVFEYRASDKGYTEYELLQLLQEAIGNEYDIKWHSVREVGQDDRPTETTQESDDRAEDAGELRSDDVRNRRVRAVPEVGTLEEELAGEVWRDEAEGEEERGEI